MERGAAQYLVSNVVDADQDDDIRCPATLEDISLKAGQSARPDLVVEQPVPGDAGVQDAESASIGVQRLKSRRKKGWPVVEGVDLRAEPAVNA